MSNGFPAVDLNGRRDLLDNLQKKARQVQQALSELEREKAELIATPEESPSSPEADAGYTWDGFDGDPTGNADNGWDLDAVSQPVKRSRGTRLQQIEAEISGLQAWLARLLDDEDKVRNEANLARTDDVYVYFSDGGQIDPTGNNDCAWDTDDAWAAHVAQTLRDAEQARSVISTLRAAEPAAAIRDGWRTAGSRAAEMLVVALAVGLALSLWLSW
jgi:hypothetical protein